MAREDDARKARILQALLASGLVGSVGYQTRGNLAPRLGLRTDAGLWAAGSPCTCARPLSPGGLLPGLSQWLKAAPADAADPPAG